MPLRQAWAAKQATGPEAKKKVLQLLAGPCKKHQCLLKKERD
jgi:hypothetical protein